MPDLSKANEYNTGSNAEKSKIADEVINSYNKPSLKNIETAMKHAFVRHGLNETTNPFIRFFDELPFNPTQDMDGLFQKLVQMESNDLVDLSHAYLKDKSLYERKLSDFEYTINSFESVLDPSVVNKYFDNTTDVNIKAFYIDNDTNKGIKPAGLEEQNKTFDTIYGTIEIWQENYGKKSDDDDISISKYIKSKNFTDNEFVNDIVNKMNKTGMAGKIKDVYEPKHSDMQWYKDKFLEIMSSNSKDGALSSAEKNRIIKNKGYFSLDKVPESEKTDGNIVAAKATVAVTTQDLDKDPDAMDKAWLDNGSYCLMIYNNGKWQKYDDYEQTKSKDNSKEIKKKFLNSKVINNPKDTYSILAGILLAIDNIIK